MDSQDIHFTVIFGNKGDYNKYFFNMIVYDKKQMELANYRMNYYGQVNFTDAAGGEYPIPAES